jgi:hypothetical protein
MRRLRPALAAFLALWLFLAPDSGPPVLPDEPVCIQPPPEPPEPPAAAPDRGEWVSVELIVIRGSRAWVGIESALEPIAEQLGYTRLTGFSVLSRAARNLRPGEALVADVSGRELRIDLVSLEEGGARLRPTLWTPDRKRLLDSTITVHWDKSFLIAGPRLDDDDVLVAAVTVR